MTDRHSVFSCSICGRPLGNRYGLDLVGRAYCRRFSCRISLWLRKRLRTFAYKLERWSRRP